MKRALIIGYYGHQNGGDDAFLTVSAWGARRYLGVDEVWANTSMRSNIGSERVRPLDFPWTFRGCAMLSRLRRRYWLPRIQHVVFGGGSNFHTTEIIQDFTATVRAAGCGPHFALGISVGPFRDAGAASACAELFSLLRYVGVRGQTSFERACKLAVPSTEVEQTFDLAALLPVVTGATLRQTGTDNKALAVCLCNHERFCGGDLAEEARRIEIVAQSIAQCVREKVCEQVVLVDMNSHASEGDAELHMHLAQRLEGVVSVSHKSYEGEPFSTMQLLSEVKGVLAMRLHAAVFAFCAGTPFATIAYHEKCFEWMKAVGGADSLILPAHRLEAAALGQMLKTLMTGAADTRPRVKIEQAIAASQRNWEKARQCLSGSRRISTGAEPRGLQPRGASALSIGLASHRGSNPEM